MKTQKSMLIIGGTGFIGHHLAVKCKKLKWRVTSISTKKPQPDRKVKGVTYLICNIGNLEKLKKVIKDDFNYVVNLGGYIDHYDKEKTFRSHYLGVKNLSTIFLKKNINSFIQIGSSTEYGKLRSPHKEQDKCKPKLIYGKSKLLATNYLINLYKKYKFPVTILRFYLVFGPKQSKNRFIPIIINSCLKKIKFDCSDGKQKRDFLYVEDSVDSIIRAIKSKKTNGKIINIGTGKTVTLKKIIDYLVRKIEGGKPQFGKVILRKDEPKIMYPSLKIAVKLLKWKPKISFSKGLNKTIIAYTKANI